MKKNSIYILFIILFVFTACKENYMPKKYAYYRLTFPNTKHLVTYQNNDCPFSFQYPDYWKVQKDSNDLQELSNHPCWFNLVVPEHKVKIYFSYTAIDETNNLDKLIKDSYKMSFKHAIKADYIDDIPFKTKNNVEGVMYDVGGNAASGLQFYLTDSITHFLRGSLYFYNPPNYDSIAPAFEYFSKDVDVIVNSFSWQ